MKYQEKKKHDKCRSYLDLSYSSSDQEIHDHALLPLCPKPRRPLPFACNLHSQRNGDDRSVFLNPFTDNKGVEESRRCMGWSPPKRTGNPVVHDVQFVNQILLSPKLNF